MVLLEKKKKKKENCRGQVLFCLEPKKVEQLFSGVWDPASWQTVLREFLKIWKNFTVEGLLFMADWA